jgi:hypothetical protein
MATLAGGIFGGVKVALAAIASTRVFRFGYFSLAPTTRAVNRETKRFRAEGISLLGRRGLSIEIHCVGLYC